jgi:hypothetical protein
MRIRLLLLAVLALLVASCGSGDDSYSADEVRAAFETEGYELVEPPPDPSGFALNPWETGGHVVLAPSDGTAFKVYVGEASAAEATPGDAEFEVARANVLVISDGELAVADRERIRTVLEGLPDRGSPVVLAE